MVELVDHYPHILKSVLDCYITQKRCDEAANIYSSATPFVTECFKTCKMCGKAVPDQYKNQ